MALIEHEARVGLPRMWEHPKRTRTRRGGAAGRGPAARHGPAGRDRVRGARGVTDTPYLMSR